MERQKVATTIYTLNVLSELMRNRGVISVDSVPGDSLTDSEERQQEQIPRASTPYALDSFLGLPLDYGTISVIGIPGTRLTDSKERQQEQVPGITISDDLEQVSEWLLSYRNASVVPGHSFLDNWFTDSEEEEQELGVMKVYFFSSQRIQEIGVSPAPSADGIFVNDEETGQVTITSIRTFEIEDPVFEETYTAHVKKDATGWTGWIPDIPEVECREPKSTAEDLRGILANKLHEVLEAKEKEWKRHFGEAVKSGKLEPLREEALEDVRAGRFTYL